MTKELDRVTANLLKDQERFQKVVADVANIRNALAHQMMPTMQAVEKFNRQMAPTVEAINKINQQMEPFTRIAKNIEANLAPFRSIALEMQNNLNLIAASVNTKYLYNSEFIRLASQANNIAKIVADLQSERISEVYVQTVQIYSGSESSDPIQAAITQIEEKVQSPGTVLSFEFYLSVVFSIILSLIAQSLSEESDELLFERLDRLESTLLQSYRAAEKEEEGASFYIVKRSVNFRDGPSAKSGILDVLYPNQKVKLISRESKWIEVEYYDHIDDSYKQGWVFKKYLRLFNRKAPAKYEKP
ncbi:SH3 domain-containing protein [Leucothrix sargassi]|nr:SH3 domain-containing protein [Leucothrix sargassi]